MGRASICILKSVNSGSIIEAKVCIGSSFRSLEKILLSCLDPKIDIGRFWMINRLTSSILELIKYKYIFMSMSIQLLGPLASFLIIFMIAHTQGAIAQGNFALVKSYFDVMVAIGLFGLPQSIIYFINKHKVSRKYFFHFSFKYSTIFYLLIFLLINISYVLTIWPFSITISTANILLIAASGYILYGIWRAIYITFNDRTSYAVLTAIPNILLLLTVFIFIFLKKQNYEVAYLMASILVITISFNILKPSIRNNMTNSTSISIKNLFNNGIYVFIHTVMFSIQLLLSYQFIIWFGGSKSEIGYFSTGYYVIQIPLLVLATLIPLLFNHLSSMQKINIDKIKKLSISSGSISIIFSVFLFLLAKPFVESFFGKSYEESIIIIQILSIYIPFIIVQRIFIVYFDSIGKPKFNALLSAMRVTLMLLLALIFYKYGFSRIISITLSTVVSELIILIVYILFIRKDLYEPNKYSTISS